MMTPEKWEELSRRGSLGLSFSGPMATDIMAYANELRGAIEAAYMECVNEGFDTDEVPDGKREWQIKNRWQRSSARLKLDSPTAVITSKSRIRLRCDVGIMSAGEIGELRSIVTHGRAGMIEMEVAFRDGKVSITREGVGIPAIFEVV